MLCNEEKYINHYQHLELINTICFTHREIDIISCILNCRGVKKIASLLFISPKTVEVHIRNIMLKLRSGSQESIIDFVEKSTKFSLIKKHYFYLLIENKFILQLNKLINQQNLFCNITYDLKDNYILGLIEQLEKHLKILNIKITKNIKDSTEFNVGAKQCNLYITSNKFIEKFQKENQNINQLFQPYTKHKQIMLFLFTDNKIKSFITKKLYYVEYIDFIQPEKYYDSVFRLLERILKINVKPLILDFKSQLEILYKGICSENKPSLNKVLPQGETLYRYSLIKYFTENIYKQLFQSSYSLRKIFLMTFIICIGFSYYYIISYKNQIQLIRSEFPLPNNTTLLQRPSLISKIKDIFSKQQGIKTVVIVGAGGAGKTTLARQYVRLQPSSIIWEINSETENNIINSFELLAYELSKTEKEKKELEMINNVVDFKERKNRLLSFTKKCLKYQSNWLLIYDNVNTFSEIYNYFPHNKNVWGKGKVIITTRDANIKNNSYIGSKNIIQIGTLNSKEQLALFTNIVKPEYSYNSIHLQKEKLVEFIKAIPPFPLDISIAGYYIKDSKIPYTKYLDNISNKNATFSTIQKAILKDIGSYQKTRSEIVLLPLKNLIKINKEFIDLLLLMSLLDSQEIPKDLLSTYKNNVEINDFLHYLKKHSLIISDSFVNKLNTSTFSIHRSTQAIILSYLTNVLKLGNNELILQSITNLLKKYVVNATNEINIYKIRLLVKHVEKFLSHIEFLNDKLRVELVCYLGRIYYYLGDYIKAQKLLQQSILIYKKYNIKDKTKIAWALMYLGKIYRNFGDYVKAQKILEESNSIYKRYYGKNHIKVAWVSIHLGNIYRSLGLYTMAKNLLEKNLPIYMKQYGKNHVKVAWAKTHLGTIYKDLGLFSKAQKILEQSNSVYKEYYGENHPLTAWSSVSLGKAYGYLGQYTKAKNLLEKNLLIYKRYYGENHIQTAWVLRGLGKIYILEGKNMLFAKSKINKSLNILKKINHPDIYNSLESLAEIYSTEAETAKNKKIYLNYKNKAISYLTKVLYIVKKIHPAKSQHILRIKANLNVLSEH